MLSEASVTAFAVSKSRPSYRLPHQDVDERGRTLNLSPSQEHAKESPLFRLHTDLAQCPIHTLSSPTHSIHLPQISLVSVIGFRNVLS